MDHLITFVIAFGGALVAFALQRGMLVEEIRASRRDAERHASRFRDDHCWMVVVAAEIDDILEAHPERSNAAILEGLRASARSGARFTVEQVAWLRPADIGRARQWHTPGLANAPAERFFYRHVEKTLERTAAHLERYPELARSVAQDRLTAARECGLLAPPDAGPAMDAAGHVRWIAEQDASKAASSTPKESPGTPRVHATVHVLRSGGARASEATPVSAGAAKARSAEEQDE